MIDSKTALQVQLQNEPVSLDPAVAEDGVSLRVLANLMDGLYCFDGAGDLQPCLAEGVEISEDRRKYTFTLRPQARWSDGLPVTAGEFVAGFRRSLDPKHSGKLAAMLDPIRGAREFRTGKGEWDQVGVRVEGDKLVIELVEPVSYFLQLLTLPGAYPARAEGWQEKGPFTGPYKLMHRVPEQHIFLDINDACWRREVLGQRPMRPVIFRVVSDESTGLALFETGRLDILTRVPSLDLERAKKLGTYREDPFYATYYLGIHAREGKPDAATRRRWNALILREPIVQALGTGERPTLTWIPPGLEGHVPYRSQAVAAPAATSGQARVKVEAGFDSNSRNRQVLEIVQKQLAAGGVDLQLSPMDWKSYVKRLTSDPPTIYRMGWLAPIRDPIPYLEVFTRGGANNATGWSNDRYETLVKEIRVLPSGDARSRKIREAQEILEREVPVIPLYHYVQTHLLSKRVTSFRVNPFGVIRFEEIGVDGEKDPLTAVRPAPPR